MKIKVEIVGIEQIVFQVKVFQSLCELKKKVEYFSTYIVRSRMFAAGIQ